MITGKINLITPPDLIFTSIDSILLIHPSTDIKIDLEQHLSLEKDPINIYVYDKSAKDLKWLLSVAHMVDIIVIDIDNIANDVSHLTSYILSLPNTWYRTYNNSDVWELINKNKFFKLSEILKVQV